MIYSRVFFILILAHSLSVCDGWWWSRRRSYSYTSGSRSRVANTSSRSRVANTNSSGFNSTVEQSYVYSSTHLYVHVMEKVEELKKITQTRVPRVLECTRQCLATPYCIFYVFEQSGDCCLYEHGTSNGPIVDCSVVNTFCYFLLH